MRRFSTTRCAASWCGAAGGEQHYVLKTRIKRRQVILTIGRHGKGAWGPEKARREAIRLLGIIRDGKDPAAERAADKAALTLAALAERYMREYSERRKKKRTIEEDRRLLKLHVLPTLGRLQVHAISKTDVARFHASMHATRFAADRALALLSGMLGWAERIGERPDGSNPCRHVDRNPETGRERFLSADELAQLGDALDAAGTPWTDERRAAWRKECARQAAALQISGSDRAAWIDARMPTRDGAEDQRAIAACRPLIFTGARLGEILSLQWEWIDPDRGVARLPDSKTGAKTLFLPAPALELLAAMPRFAANPHVIPGDKPGAPFVGIQKPWQRIRALAGLSDLRLHDLRHGFASAGVAAGESLFIVGKLLGHRQSRTTERYAHLAPDPAKAVADRTAARLEAMLRGDVADVETLAPGARKAG